MAEHRERSRKILKSLPKRYEYFDTYAEMLNKYSQRKICEAAIWIEDEKDRDYKLLEHFHQTLMKNSETARINLDLRDGLDFISWGEVQDYIDMAQVFLTAKDPQRLLVERLRDEDKKVCASYVEAVERTKNIEN